MNLIVNRQLDRAQKQVIYELTLKKHQSKKSTMSEKQMAARQQLARELTQERSEMLRLEHLNDELERRLHQYEYLVAREKALLGAYNMMLFTNEGVNNFHLYDALSTPSRRLRTFQQQQKTGAHRNSSAASLASSTSSSSNSGPSEDTVRPTLSSSASTVSNLNTLHMLPTFAGPRRSASSVALLNMNQGQLID